jgi:hypothetical protein
MTKKPDDEREGQEREPSLEAELRERSIALDRLADEVSSPRKLTQPKGELRVRVVAKDPATGLLVTEEYVVKGPISLCLTTE